MKCYLKKKQNLFTFQYVSINMLGSLAGSAAGLLFTFQYVSINIACSSSFF